MPENGQVLRGGPICRARLACCQPQTIPCAAKSAAHGDRESGMRRSVCRIGPRRGQCHRQIHEPRRRSGWGSVPVVIGKVPCAATIAPGASCERQEMLKLIAHLDRGDVMVLDRGYPSFEKLQALTAAGIEFVIRCPD